MGSEEARGSQSGRLDALTGWAGGDKGANCAGHPGPPKQSGDAIECLQVTRVTGGRRVMKLHKKAGAKGRVLWYTDPILEVPEIVF